MSSKLFSRIPQQATIFTVVALLYFAIPLKLVSAHQQKAAISTILFNERSGNIEVMHRFVMHDAEHAVKQLFDKEADIHFSEKTQAQFTQYVMERFTLNSELAPIELTSVGYEVDGRHFWVYQEASNPGNLQSLSITNEALQDIWPSQTNTVVVEGNGPIKSLVFSNEDGVKTIRFD